MKTIAFFALAALLAAQQASALQVKYVEGTPSEYIADGVTPTDGEEWTFRVTFDYRTDKYSVAVLDALQAWRDCAAAGGVKAFALAVEKNSLSSVSFKGETSFTSLLGRCADKMRNFMLIF